MSFVNLFIYIMSILDIFVMEYYLSIIINIIHLFNVVRALKVQTVCINIQEAI